MPFLITTTSAAQQRLSNGRYLTKPPFTPYEFEDSDTEVPPVVPKPTKGKRRRDSSPDAPIISPPSKHRRLAKTIVGNPETLKSASPAPIDPPDSMDEFMFDYPYSNETDPESEPESDSPPSEGGQTAEEACNATWGIVKGLGNDRFPAHPVPEAPTRPSDSLPRSDQSHIIDIKKYCDGEIARLKRNLQGVRNINAVLIRKNIDLDQRIWYLEHPDADWEQRPRD